MKLLILEEKLSYLICIYFLGVWLDWLIYAGVNSIRDEGKIWAYFLGRYYLVNFNFRYVVILLWIIVKVFEENFIFEIFFIFIYGII